MIATLTRALNEGRVEEKLKSYTVPRLLIIDEIATLSPLGARDYIDVQSFMWVIAKY